MNGWNTSGIFTDTTAHHNAQFNLRNLLNYSERGKMSGDVFGANGQKHPSAPKWLLKSLAELLQVVKSPS